MDPRYSTLSRSTTPFAELSDIQVLVQNVTKSTYRKLPVKRQQSVTRNCSPIRAKSPPIQVPPPSGSQRYQNFTREQYSRSHAPAFDDVEDILG